MEKALGGCSPAIPHNAAALCVCVCAPGPCMFALAYVCTYVRSVWVSGFAAGVGHNGRRSGA